MLINDGWRLMKKHTGKTVMNYNRSCRESEQRTVKTNGCFTKRKTAGRTILFLFLTVLAALLFTGYGCSKKAAESHDKIEKPKLFIVGLDAATFEVIDPLIQKNELPNFKRILEEGTSAPLQTLIPTESPIVWSSMATGVNPTKHGIQTFTRRIPGTDDTVPLHSDYRKSSAFWSIFSDFGFSVVQIKWWTSWPADRVKGLNISARLHQELKFGKTFPRNIYPWVDLYRGDNFAALKQPPGMVKPVLSNVSAPVLKQNKPQKKKPQGPPILSTAIAKSFNDDSLMDLALPAYKKYDPDVFTIYFKSIDKIEHFLWASWAKRGNEPYSERTQKLIYYYTKFDQWIGETGVLDDPETYFFLISDHGMELSSETPNINSPWRLDGDRVLELLGYLEKNDKDKTDWNETVLYTRERRPCDYAFRFSLNKTGREPSGTVEEDQANEIVENAVKKLHSLKTASGEPFFTQVRPVRHSVYEIEAILNSTLKETDRLKMNDRLIPMIDLIFKPWTPEGVHINAPPGILLAKGPGIRQGVRINSAHIYDFLPTLLYLARIPIGRDMEGDVLKSIFEKQFTMHRPVSYVDTHTHQEQKEETFAVQPGDSLIKDELKALGYIDG